MKKKKYVVGGGTVSSILLLLILSLVFSSAVFAASPGDSINYTASHIGTGGLNQNGTAVFKATVDGIQFEGTCAQLGVDLASSGTGQINKAISGDTREGKIFYDIIVNRGFFDKKTEAAGSEIDHPYTNWTYAFLVECASQIAQQGDNWYSMLHAGSIPDEVQATVDHVWDWYQNYDVSGVTVPNDFVMYYVTESGGNQNFMLWGFAPQAGKLKLKKSSTNTSITG